MTLDYNEFSHFFDKRPWSEAHKVEVFAALVRIGQCAIDLVCEGGISSRGKLLKGNSASALEDVEYHHMISAIFNDAAEEGEAVP